MNEDMIDHQWKRTSNLSYCKVCKVIKGSDKNKQSKCSGKNELIQPNPLVEAAPPGPWPFQGHVKLPSRSGR